MRRNKNSKKWMVGVLSAALLFSGAAALTPKAFADDDWPAYIKVKTALNEQQFIADWMKYIVANTATIADQDMEYISQRIAGGESLAQASGVSTEVLAQNLIDLARQSITDASNDYIISADQANKLQLDLNAEIRKAIGASGYKGFQTSDVFNYSTFMKQYLSGVKAAAFGNSSREYEDFINDLDGGMGLAAAAGINESAFINELLVPVTQKIDDAVQANVLTASEGDDLKDQARSAITAAVQAPGGSYDDSAMATEDFLNNKLQSIVSSAFMVTDNGDLDYIDVIDAYRNGGSLAQILHTPATELAQRVLTMWETDLQSGSGLNGVNDRAAFEKQALQDIISAITASGK
ncbi:hypothetical protein [Paenibacillus thalictri]|uniref:Copper amine oxidase n=1 Tax=Paenibacillus thalictri TaxID=2527873 RepID=A0A4V2J3T2_9BACL|nr:hypothetical protein [Paenibacillus thalictri]TBL75336.1 hypothetical protein EYB31_23290 [Paenibacillus thalictri]